MFYKSYRCKLNLIILFICSFLVQLNASQPPVPLHLMQDLDDPANGFISSVETWAKDKNINLTPLIVFSKTRNIDIISLIKQDLDFFKLTKDRVDALPNSTDPTIMKEFLKSSYWKFFSFTSYTHKAQFLSNYPRNEKEEYINTIINVLHSLANDAVTTQELTGKVFSCEEFTYMAREKPKSLNFLPKDRLSLLEGIEEILPSKFKNKKNCSIM